MSDQEQDRLSSLTYGAILPTLCSLGLAGNVLCIVVLSRKRFAEKDVFVFLRAQAWADAAYLAFTLQVIPFN